MNPVKRCVHIYVTANKFLIVKVLLLFNYIFIAVHTDCAFLLAPHTQIMFSYLVSVCVCVCSRARINNRTD